MATIKGDILKGNTHTIILTLLEEQPMYGFQITSEVDRRSKGILSFRAGMLYPTLHQLEKEKLVESDWHSSNQGPRRKYYKLTAKGKKEVERLRKRWRAFSKAINQVLNAYSVR
jgi:PadR family transcriptional regulator, regulatory protein PadR